MSIDGLPLHPLVVHAAVVVAPLAGLLAVLYAVVPAWRGPLRHVVPALALVALVLVQVAVMSGEDLKEVLPANPAIEDHAELGRQVRITAINLVPIALLGWWALPVRAVRGARGGRILGIVAMVLLVMGGAAVVGTTLQTGHSGATAVWGGLL